MIGGAAHERREQGAVEIRDQTSDQAAFRFADSRSGGVRVAALDGRSSPAVFPRTELLAVEAVSSQPTVEESVSLPACWEPQPAGEQMLRLQEVAVRLLMAALALSAVRDLAVQQRWRFASPQRTALGALQAASQACLAQPHAGSG